LSAEGEFRLKRGLVEICLACMFGNGFGPSGPPDNVSTLFLVPPFSIKGVVYSVKCGGEGEQPRKRWEKNREKRKRRICEIKRVKIRVKWLLKEPKGVQKVQK
jgi:hypothetical protein